MCQKTCPGQISCRKLRSRLSSYYCRRDYYLVPGARVKVKMEGRGGYNRCHIGYRDSVIFGASCLVEIDGRKAFGEFDEWVGVGIKLTVVASLRLTISLLTMLLEQSTISF
jgi:hypothetical protein